MGVGKPKHSALADVSGKKLRQGEALIQAMFQRAPVGILMTDASGHIVLANKRYLQLLGYSEKELYRMSVADVTHREDFPRCKQLLRELHGGKRRHFTTEKRYRRKNGGIIWVRNTVALAHENPAGPRHVIAIVEDITERKHTENKLRRTLERSRTTELELTKANSRLTLLSRRLLTVQELERRHLARELHDEIGQALTAMSIILNSKLPNDRREFSEKRKNCIQIVDQLLHSVRGLSLNLRPPQLDDLGLVAALHWLIDQHAARGESEFHADIDSVKVSLDHESEVACFRVCQEALNNAARHGKAKNINVDLVKRGGTLRLTVFDDGKGFTLRTVHKLAPEGSNIGLVGMEERVALVSGELKISSTPGLGTKIEAVFPLAQGAGNQRKKKRA